MTVLCCNNNIPDNSDFVISTGQFFTFGPDTRSNPVSIPIVDDNIFEAKYEHFYVTFTTNATVAKFVVFGIAELTIKDDDSKLSDSVISHNIMFGLLCQQWSTLGLTVLTTL